MESIEELFAEFKLSGVDEADFPAIAHFIATQIELLRLSIIVDLLDENDLREIQRYDASEQVSMAYTKAFDHGYSLEYLTKSAEQQFLNTFEANTILEAIK